MQKTRPLKHNKQHFDENLRLKSKNALNQILSLANIPMKEEPKSRQNKTRIFANSEMISM